MKQSRIVEVIASLLTLLFIYTALTKLLDYQNFRIQLSKSPFVTQFAGTTAWTLPIGEIFTGIALSFKRTRLFALYVSLFLMTMFTAYIYIMLHYSYYIPCSCGGVLEKMDWNTHLWFNTFFVILSIIGICLSNKRNGFQNTVRAKSKLILS